jgi:hypothetical protein
MVSIDAHVHIHPAFHLSRFLDAAHRNATRRNPAPAADAALQIVLLLAESRPTDVFSALRAVAEGGPAPTDLAPWTVQLTAEAVSLRLARPDGAALFLVAGRQVVSNDGLEAVALGLRDAPPDRQRPLAGLVASIRDAGATPVIPWGAGKWLGRRGALLRHVLTGASASQLYLGDNGGRPWFWPTPAPFATAAAKRVWTFPGSDPLPFPDHAERAGSFGFRLPGALNAASPAADLLARLRAAPAQPDRYGRLRGAAAFAWDQFRMQLRRRPAA